MRLEGFPKPDAALGMGVVVCRHLVQGLLCRRLDPFRRRKVHVSLSQVDAVCREVRGTANSSDQSAVSELYERDALENGPNILRQCPAFP